ncbi:hypothetical protein ABT336_02495 [Micromonospora sp. NPDC000207]|uniref:hypothetical protein n=1 Tax=Micromonospora sp. NPDC000207 TaxID=3154246 RepID=UPI00332CEBD4
MTQAASLPSPPPGFRAGVEEAFAALSTDPTDLKRSLARLAAVRADVMTGVRT